MGVCALSSVWSGQVTHMTATWYSLVTSWVACLSTYAATCYYYHWALYVYVMYTGVCVVVNVIRSGEPTCWQSNVSWLRASCLHPLSPVIIIAPPCGMCSGECIVISVCGWGEPTWWQPYVVVRIRHRLLLLLSPVICVQVGSLSSVSSGEVNPHDGNLTLLSASAIAYYYYLALWYVYRWVRCRQCRQVRWTHTTATWRFLAMCSAAYLLTFVSANSCCSATCLESWRKRSSSVSTVTASSALHRYAVGC